MMDQQVPSYIFLDGQAGSNSLTIEAAQLNNAKGVLTYSLTFGEDTQTRKLVILP